MSLIISATIAWLFGFGIYLLLKPSFLNLVLGVALLGHSVNMSLFYLGGLKTGTTAIIPEGSEVLLPTQLDPLPQALVLTAIVIGFGMQAFLLVVAAKASKSNNTASVEKMGGDL